MKLYILSTFVFILVFVLYFLSKIFFEKNFKIKREAGESLIPFGEKLGAIGGIYLFLAPIVAMEWGYVPTILITLAMMIFLGYPLSFLSTLLGLRENLKEKLTNNKYFKNIILIFLIIFSLIISISFIHYTTELLGQNRGISTSFLLLIFLSFIFSYFLMKKKEEIIPYTIFFLVFLFYIIFLGGFYPFSLPFKVVTEKFTFGLIVIGLIILFVFLKDELLSKPFSYLSSYLLFVILFAGFFGPFIGLRIQREEFIFVSSRGLMIPLIFGTLSFVVFSGFESLFSILYTSNEVKGEKSVSKVSLLPLSILSLTGIVSSFSLIIYAKTEPLIKGKDPLTLFQEGMAKFLRFAGLSESYSKNFVLFLTVVFMFSFIVYSLKSLKKCIGYIEFKRGNLIVPIIIILTFLTFFLPKDFLGGITNWWLRLINVNTSANFLLASIMLLFISFLLKLKEYIFISKILNILSTLLFIYLIFINLKDFVSLFLSIIFLSISLSSLYLSFKIKEYDKSSI
ncbi:MAG: carbon starvation CstA family protein [Caldisericia bacterium]|jgi:hypothetical protein|nr:carbon starvation CstA family protein [Caldisericia bacterium]